MNSADDAQKNQPQPGFFMASLVNEAISLSPPLKSTSFTKPPDILGENLF